MNKTERRWPYREEQDDDYVEPYDETEDARRDNDDWDFGI